MPNFTGIPFCHSLARQLEPWCIYLSVLPFLASNEWSVSFLVVLCVVAAGAAADDRLGQDRPVSAPRLDHRTSSPVGSASNGGVASSQDGSAKDVMNMSQPVRSSRCALNTVTG